MYFKVKQEISGGQELDVDRTTHYFNGSNGTLFNSYHDI